MQNALIIKNPLIVEQNNLKLYVFKLNSEEIYNHFNVSRRLHNKDEGYQRIVKENKIKEIKAYLGGKSADSYPSILPSNILIALDNIKYDDKNNELIIQDNEDGYKGLIIDGQHRAKGSYEFDPKFELLVVGIGDLDTKYQARLFIKINDTQTPLPASLYMELISMTSDEDIRNNLDGENITAEQKAVEILRDLNDNDDSSLNNLIAITGEERNKISLSSLAPFIKEYINYTDGKFKNYSFNQQVQIFKNYFNAIKVVFEDDWNNGTVFKTTVYGGLLKSLDDVFHETHTMYKNFKENSI
ncbi:MAG TPA: DGQHR domain-containing protein, partial [Campylobacterales bacterium]|nr:DGQHR domain-containing protein [Campylobacterales bacterium]